MKKKKSNIKFTKEDYKKLANLIAQEEERYNGSSLADFVKYTQNNGIEITKELNELRENMRKYSLLTSSFLFSVINANEDLKKALTRTNKL